MKNKETGGDTTLDEEKEEIIYRIELPANRYGPPARERLPPNSSPPHAAAPPPGNRWRVP